MVENRVKKYHPTTTMSTTTTTTTVASMKSLTSPIRSSSIGEGCDLFGLNVPQHCLGAEALQTDIEATMQKLEFEVKFARDELTAEYDKIIADIQDEGKDDFTRKLKKATVLVDMRDEERKRDACEYTLTYTCGTINEERRKAVKRDIRKMSRLITALKVAASDEGLVGVQAVQSPLQMPIEQVYPYRAARITPLDLPRFNGNIAKFRGFNTNFDGLIRSSGIPEEFWGIYLYEHLDEKSKTYVGSSSSWLGRYEELWELLKSRYANRWTVPAETIKATIMSTPPEGNDWEKMVEYMDEQLDLMQSLKALELTNEQLATNVLLMKLPKDFSNAMRNGLRIARMDKGNEDFKFTPQEFREVMNDTVMSWKTTQPHLVESTMVLQATTSPKTSGPQSSQPSSQGKKSNRKGNSYRPEYCALCDTNDHKTPKCVDYVGATDRRNRLSSLNKCPDCTQTHRGDCLMRFKCRICSDGKHLDYLCPKPKKPNAK